MSDLSENEREHVRSLVAAAAHENAVQTLIEQGKRDEVKREYGGFYDNHPDYGTYFCATVESILDELSSPRAHAMTLKSYDLEAPLSTRDVKLIYKDNCGVYHEMWERARAQTQPRTKRGPRSKKKSGMATGSSDEHTKSLVDSLERETGATINLVRSGDDLHLYLIAVPKGSRGHGTGSRIMKALVAHANERGLRMRLTPALRDPKWGTTSRTRLVKFYKRFGFVENKGRHKDFSLGAAEMYREPTKHVPWEKVLAKKRGLSSGITMRPVGWNAASDDVCMLTRKGHVYRGMTEGEWSFIKKHGRIESDMRFSHHSEGTCFSEDAADAESYVNFGQSDPRRSGAPTYLIEVRITPSMKQDRDGYWKSRTSIAASNITRAWKMENEGGAIVGREVGLETNQ